MPWWEDYPSAGPIRVDNGIKARSARGAIATTWWSRRFIAVLEDMRLGGRLSRGRSYARAGQVLRIAVESGRVGAEVQGSRARPYEAELLVRPFDDGQWDRVVAALADRALYAAKLLAGRMPEEIEEAFAGLGMPLFPRDTRDLAMRCSCPDWAVPCKHLAAVCYLLAERFDEDPFLIFQWRGRTKEDLLEQLRARRGRGSSDVPAVPDESAGEAAFPGADLLDVRERPLAAALEAPDDFYTEGPAGHPSARATELSTSDQLLREAPPSGIEVDGRRLDEVLAPVYAALGDVAEPD